MKSYEKIEIYDTKLIESLSENYKTIIENLIRQIKQTINDLIIDFVRAYEDNQIKLSANYLLKAKYLKKAIEDLKIKKQKLL